MVYYFSVYILTLDGLQVASNDLAQIFRVWTLWQPLVFFQNFVAIEFQVLSSHLYKMMVEKIYLNHVSSSVNEFAVQWNFIGLLMLVLTRKVNPYVWAGYPCHWGPGVCRT